MWYNQIVTYCCATLYFFSLLQSAGSDFATQTARLVLIHIAMLGKSNERLPEVNAASCYLPRLTILVPIIFFAHEIEPETNPTPRLSMPTISTFRV